MAQVVLGGGISGLATAYYLSKSAANSIRIYESTNRLGGWIRSVKSESGALFELGPRTLRYDAGAAQNTLELVKELNLMPNTMSVPSRSKIVGNRMIYLNNQLIRVPSGFTSLFRINPPFVRPFWHAFLKDYTTPKKTVEDDSIHEFVCRRFGEDYAETVVSALVCGIFAGDAKDISVKAVWSSLFEMEQTHGSILRGIFSYIKKQKEKVRNKKPEQLKWSVWSFKNGLETLPAALSDYLNKTKNVELYLEKECSGIDFRNGKAILTIGGKEEIADHVYSSLPSRILAKLLSHAHPFLKAQLSSIPFVSVGIVNLEFAGDLLKEKGFGCLIPPNQNLPVLGIAFDSHIFPQGEKTVLSVLMGGKWFEHYFGTNPKEEKLLQTALEHVKKILHIEAIPVSSRVTIAKDCLPQYTVGHSKKIKEIRAYITNKKLPLTLVGNSFDGVGVNDSILSAREGVEGH